MRSFIVSLILHAIAKWSCCCTKLARPFDRDVTPERTAAQQRRAG